MSERYVKNIFINTLSVTVPQYAQELLPKELKQEEASFELHNVNLAVANGIRRVIESGVKTLALNVDIEHIKCTDEFMTFEFILPRLRMIPIMQSVDPKMTFSLKVMNNTHNTIEVLTDNLVPSKAITKPLFDKNIPICTLRPNCGIEINNIYIDDGTASNYGGYTLAHGVVCLPLDQEPYNPFTGKGIKSGISDPRKHLIKFQTNGTIPPKELVISACSTIIERLDYIQNMLDNIYQSKDVHRLVIHGEDATIGNLLAMTIIDQNPKISMCSFNVNAIDKIMTLELRVSDPKDIIGKAIIACVDTLNDIRDGFK